MSHTPGKWEWCAGGELRAGPDGHLDVITLGDDGGCSDPECCGGASYHIEVSDDDQRLISAAPELLAAAKAALNDRMYKDWPGVADLLIAAIAKAQGHL